MLVMPAFVKHVRFKYYIYDICACNIYSMFILRHKLMHDGAKIADADECNRRRYDAMHHHAMHHRIIIAQTTSASALKRP